MNKNIVTSTDSYKFTHHNMTPKGTEYIYSYFESRKGAEFDSTMFFGLQYIMKEYLEGMVVTQGKIDRAAKLSKAHFGNDSFFNRDGWEYILKEHGGSLPVRIKAIPEGMIVPVSNVMMTIENTDPKCAFLTNHLETILTHIWSPSTVATASRATKDIIRKHLMHTTGSDDGIDFMLHDFGFRGASSYETAATAGAGHLINFKGSDTVPAIEMIMDYYNTDNMPAFSVAATEHSIMTSKGRNGESDVVKDLLSKYPSGILSVVSDSYDIYHACNYIYGELFKDKILSRDGIFVVRPDSGDPVEVTCKVLDILWEKFSGKLNDFGFKVINPKIRVLWGDGINRHDVDNILTKISKKGFSAENVIFGMGGGLLQKWNRDTQRFAFKSSAQCRDGEWFDIYKDPIEGGKSSKKGRLSLYRMTNNELVTTKEGAISKNKDILQTVFENGKIKKEWSFEEVKENSLM